MSIPKRHHWWPQLHSGHWCNDDGKINVLNRDGTSFKGTPNGLGVVGHLYSKELEGGSKDTSIETWFANDVDGPFVSVLQRITDESQVKKRQFRGDPEKAAIVRSLGFRTPDYAEYVDISISEREAISKCIAAVLVRSPKYLSKLEDFHRDALEPKNNALDNMKYVYRIYVEKIMESDLILIRRDAENEFLFSDGGIVAREPWSKRGGIPFDIHFPMTPDDALQVLPAMKQAFGNSLSICRASNRGIAGQNRISLQYAENQVFGRGPLPIAFIKKNWGRPAPQHIAFRHVDGKLDTKVDWSRFYY